MKPAERPEFESQLGVLCAGMDVPCTDERKEAYWRALQEMSLPVFIRTIEFMLREEDWTRMPKPGQVWASSKRMRSHGPVDAPKDDGFRGDEWDIAANRHLMTHIARQLRGKPLRYGRPASAEMMRKLDRKVSPNADASPEFVANVGLLVEAKREWARNMRAYGTSCPVDIQRQCWDQRMGEAEAEIAARQHQEGA